MTPISVNIHEFCPVTMPVIVAEAEVAGLCAMDEPVILCECPPGMPVIEPWE